jgi:hypothetical protein
MTRPFLLGRVSKGVPLSCRRTCPDLAPCRLDAGRLSWLQRAGPSATLDKNLFGCGVMVPHAARMSKVERGRRRLDDELPEPDRVVASRLTGWANPRRASDSPRNQNHSYAEEEEREHRSRDHPQLSGERPRVARCADGNGATHGDQLDRLKSVVGHSLHPQTLPASLRQRERLATKVEKRDLIRSQEPRDRGEVCAGRQVGPSRQERSGCEDHEREQGRSGQHAASGFRRTRLRPRSWYLWFSRRDVLRGDRSIQAGQEFDAPGNAELRVDRGQMTPNGGFRE